MFDIGPLDLREHIEMQKLQRGEQVSPPVVLTISSLRKESNEPHPIPPNLRLPCLPRLACLQRPTAQAYGHPERIARGVALGAVGGDEVSDQEFAIARMTNEST